MLKAPVEGAEIIEKKEGESPFAYHFESEDKIIEDRRIEEP